MTSAKSQESIQYTSVPETKI